MYEIGKIEDYPVMRCKSMRDIDVIESVSNEQIVDIIKNSKAYYEATHNGLINGSVKIVTWLDSASYRDITYNIQLIRIFSVGFAGYKNGVGNTKIIHINESDSHFEIIFTGESSDLKQFFDAELSEDISRDAIRYVSTCGKTRAETERNMQRDIDRIMRSMIPRYIRKINKEMAVLRIKKTQCAKLFGVR